MAGLVISGRGGRLSLGRSGIVRLPFWRMGKREGDESGEDIKILGDMMSVVNFTRFNLVQEEDRNKEEEWDTTLDTRSY
jgi:hypothetical protein